MYSIVVQISYNYPPSLNGGGLCAIETVNVVLAVLGCSHIQTGMDWEKFLVSLESEGLRGDG